MAVSTIEDAYLYTLCGEMDKKGYIKIPYIVDEYYLSKSDSMGICKLTFCIGLLMVLAIWIAFNGFPGVIGPPLESASLGMRFLGTELTMRQILHKNPLTRFFLIRSHYSGARPARAPFML